MSKVLLSFAAVTLLFSCTYFGNDAPISEQDRVLADSLHFDRSAISAIRALTAAPLHILGEDAGIEFEYNPKPGKYEQIRKKLRSAGYFLFKSVENYGNLPDQYAMIKSNDQFDIIKLKGTAAPSYDISNDSLLIRLHDWHKRYSLEILGAGSDWFEARIAHIPPAELDTFAREIHAFCPDIAEEGVGNVEDLVQELKDTKTLYLWWD
ncbi:DUF4253 domain-containing protein [Chitinophaga sp.]|uniref:DUF4253 domain-containing protein n=1 Tax=Chitinophaga sp. TaxID=1869181 RepID=UPI0031D2EBED